MFDDAALRDEVEEMFGAEQERYEREVVRDLLRVRGGKDATHTQGREIGSSRSGRTERAFRVFVPNPPKSEARKAYLRSYEHKHNLEEIKVRLLAGERPKLGGRGRPPTRWFKAAAELGIDIGPLPVTGSRAHPKAARKIRMRAAARDAARAAGLPDMVVPPSLTVPAAPDSLATIGRSTDRTSAA